MTDRASRPLVVHVAEVEIGEQTGMGRIAHHWRRAFEEAGFAFEHIGPARTRRPSHKALWHRRAWDAFLPLKDRCAMVLAHEPVSGIFAERFPRTAVFSHGIERRGATAGEKRRPGSPAALARHLAARPLWRARERQCVLGLTRSPLVLLSNREDAAYLKTVLHRGPGGRVEVFRNGADAVQKPAEGSADGRTVLFFASWIRRKGSDVLVRAARRLAEGGTRLRWVLAGTGLSEADVLADWPAELRGDVTVRSRIGRPEEDGLYREADLFVLPSRFEGQPLTLVQAMRYGLCCVTTRCCGQIDLIEDGRTGILITPGSEAELADAIAGAIADRSARERIGAAARESVSDRSWEAVSREVVAAAVETFGLSVEPSPGLGPEGRRHPGSTFPLSGVEGIKHIEPAPGWPDLWRHTHEYDLREIYGDPSWPGYSCAYRMRRAETLDLIRRAAPAGGSILDVAAAQGNFSLSLAAMGYSVTWNDLRGELEGYVRQKWERGAIRYAPGNLFELDLPDRFDLVLAGEVIEHVAHPDHFLAALAGFVKEGGHLLVSTPNGGYFLNHLPRFSECRDSARYEAVQFRPDSDGHIFLLYKDEIRSMAASCGLRVEEIRLFGNPLACGHLRTGALHRWLPAGAIDGIERLARKMPLGFRRRLLSGMAVLLKKDAPEEDASRCGEVGRPC